MHPADLVPELDAAVTPAARPPPTPAAARTGEPTPSPCGPRSPPSGPAHRRPAHPRPWNGGCRAPQPPMPPPRTTRPRRPAGAAPHPARTWTVTPRLDILTQAQRRALRHLTGAAILDDDLPASACRAKRHLRRSAGTARLGRRRNRTPGNRPVLRHQRPRRSPRRRRRQNSASATATTATSPASSASPLRWTSPQHIRPEVPRPGRVPASEHPGGPGSHSPARPGPGPGSGRAGFGPGRVRAAEPWPSRAGGSHRPGPGQSQGRSRAHYHGARPVRQPGTMNAAPGEPQRARNLSGCQDQPPDLLLLWRRGAAAAMSAS